MAYQFTELKADTQGVEEWLQKELAGVRSGRAAPAILDNIRIDSYGTMTPLSHVGNISVDDARTLRVTPWDISHVKAIEKAITDADLGVSVGSDEKGVRVSFPELTSERREGLMKLVGQKHEEARQRLRAARDGVWQDIQAKEKEKELSEDEKFRAKDEMQKIIDAGNEALDVLKEKKEKELSA